MQVIDVAIDASDVPADYILAILSQCSTFPEVGRRTSFLSLFQVWAALALARVGPPTPDPNLGHQQRSFSLFEATLTPPAPLLCPSPPGPLPQELIFFLKGRLAAHYMWQRQNLAELNSYFTVDCK